MFTFIKGKMKNKRWLTVCQILGMTFLIAAISSLPMFSAGSADRLLWRAFNKSIAENNTNPAVISRTGSVKPKKDSENLNGIMKKTGEYDEVWSRYLDGIETLASQSIIELNKRSMVGSFNKDKKTSYLNQAVWLGATYVPELEDHIEIVGGVGLDEANVEDDIYPCIITDRVADSNGLSIGMLLQFKELQSVDENTPYKGPRFMVVGIFKEKDPRDAFWYVEPGKFEKEIFVSGETFDSLCGLFDDDVISYEMYRVLDFRDIDHSNVDDVAYYLGEFKKKDKGFADTIEPFIESYKEGKKTIDITLFVLELPIIGLLLAFIYKVSSQIADSERSEIASLRSRGLSRKQVLALYGGEALIIDLISMICGLLFGVVLAKLGAGTVEFLRFSTEGVDIYRPVLSMGLYAFFAAILGNIFMMLPALEISKASIVEVKAENNAGKKPFWEKFFVDIALLVLSLYLLKNYLKQIESIRLSALMGIKTDPMIFVDSVLFITAFGMVSLRLSHYLVILIEKLGRSKRDPVMYASFLQITRTFKKQGFISVFIIITVALGIFDANIARTTNKNHSYRITNDLGADVVIKEHWNKVRYRNPAENNRDEYYYNEPDRGRFNSLVEEGLLDGYTAVIRDEKTVVTLGNKKTECTLMGINTKEFGELSNNDFPVKNGVHWYEGLNELGTKRNGVIISKNLAALLEVSVGDSINLTRYGDESAYASIVLGTLSGKVVAIVDTFPGFKSYTYEEGEEKENFLVVANYAMVENAFHISPYEIWGRLKKNDPKAIRDILDNMDIRLDLLSFRDELVTEKMNSSLIQITNGMFTLSFMIALVVCGIGFLIFHITSIRQRELLFGVYRAMGLSVKDINRMLINEHVFSTLISIISGVLVGFLSTFLFGKLFGVVYLPEKHSIDIAMYFEPYDMAKVLAVVLLMVFICGFVLRRIVKSLSITEALKLGEE